MTKHASILILNDTSKYKVMFLIIVIIFKIEFFRCCLSVSFTVFHVLLNVTTICQAKILHIFIVFFCIKIISKSMYFSFYISQVYKDIYIYDILCFLLSIIMADIIMQALNHLLSPRITSLSATSLVPASSML